MNINELKNNPQVLRELRATRKRLHLLSLEDAIIQGQELLSSFRLDSSSLHNIGGLLSYCRDRSYHTSPISYGFQYNGKKPVEFALSLWQAIEAVSGENFRFLTLTEVELLSGDVFAQSDWQNIHSQAILVITNPKDEKLNEEDFRAWEHAASALRAKPEVIRLFLISSETMKKRFRDYGEVYYRLFRDLLSYREYSAGDAYVDIIQGIRSREIRGNRYELTNAFLDGMLEYVNTVYPKADLRESAFALDVVDRVLTSNYKATNHTHRIDIQHVPAYKKIEPSSPDIVKSLTAPNASSSALPIIPTYYEPEEFCARPEDESLAIRNVFVCGVSTYYNGPSSSYEYNDNGHIYNGTYQHQQAAYIKLLLDSRNMIMNDLVLLCTKEAREQKHNGLSSFELLRKEIEDYKKEKGIDTKTQYHCILIEDREDGNINIASGIEDAVTRIRHLNARSQKEFHLFLGTNGGFRNITTALEAILSLLKNEHITAEKHNIFDVKYDPSKRKGTIVHDDTFLIFDFVSGMNEFINYGKAESLLQFLKTKEGTNEELANIIKDISDAIMLCQSAQMKPALERLSNYLRDNDKTKSEDPYLRLFLDNIKKDFDNNFDDDQDTKLIYGSLLDNPSANDVVNWFVHKGFYQQALTYFEARVPVELFEKGRVKYESNVLDFVDKCRGNFERLGYAYNKIVNRSEGKFKNYKPTWDSIFSKISEKVYSEEEKKNITQELSVYIIVPQDSVHRNVITKFISAHKELKEFRNNAAHWNEDAKATQDIVKNIINKAQTYLDAWYRLPEDAIITVTDQQPTRSNYSPRPNR